MFVQDGRIIYFENNQHHDLSTTPLPSPGLALPQLDIYHYLPEPGSTLNSATEVAWQLNCSVLYWDRKELLATHRQHRQQHVCDMHQKQSLCK